MERPASERSVIDWSIIFDTIASSYGWTWDQFTALTYKQLNSFLESIAERRYNDIATRAALQGVKMEPYRKPVPVKQKTIDQARSEIYKILAEKQKNV